jgi:hypothetical protein
MMDPDWLQKYVDAHPAELATYRPDKDTLLITAKTEDFQAFLLRHERDDGAFGDDVAFTRPGDPTTVPTTAPTTGSGAMR